MWFEPKWSNCKNERGRTELYYWDKKNDRELVSKYLITNWTIKTCPLFRLKN